jgi:putative transposase
MLQRVESLFGSIDRLPYPIEWLSDNGSCYTANETRRFAKDLGFRVSQTPIQSPESNGMAELFVKTFSAIMCLFIPVPMG